MPFFSVVIPLYNKQNYIAATLQSVLAQTFSDFEIIVVNDVSTDNSLAVAQTINDSRIRIVSHEKNSGLSASRNTGIKNAVADYVAFLDADDLWKPLFLEKIQQLIVDYPEADLFASKYEEVYYGNIVIEPDFKLQTGIIDNFFLRNLNKPLYCPSALCVRKTVYEKTGLYKNVYFGEDADFNVRAHLLFKMAYCNEPLVSYEMHSENQITHASMEGKSRIDHDFYEKANPERDDLKKYLDFHRYTMAKRYKRAGDVKTYKELVSKINLKNLNKKQLILLYSPEFILKLIVKIKAYFHKRGINPTSY